MNNSEMYVFIMTETLLVTEWLSLPTMFLIVGLNAVILIIRIKPVHPKVRWNTISTMAKSNRQLYRKISSYLEFLFALQNG